MTPRSALGIAAVATLLLPLAAAAATDREKHQMRGAKYAGVSTTSPKRSMCVCQDGTSHQGALGDLIQAPGNAEIYVRCRVPTFSATGAATGVYICSTFVPLVK